MPDYSLPRRDGVVLVVVDVQEKFAGVICEWERVVGNTTKIIKGFRALNLPVIVTEQYPPGLGRTIPEVAEALGEYAPIEKTCFNCFGSKPFSEALAGTNAKDIVLCGIESHVCVLQTAHSAVESGYRVHLLADAVSSRKQIDHDTACERMRQAGVLSSTVEMILFGLIESKQDPQFKELMKIVK